MLATHGSILCIYGASASLAQTVHYPRSSWLESREQSSQHTRKSHPAESGDHSGCVHCIQLFESFLSAQASKARGEKYLRGQKWVTNFGNCRPNA